MGRGGLLKFQPSKTILVTAMLHQKVVHFLNQVPFL